MKCGDCKHWFDNGTDYCSCDRDALLRERDFFCAAWERKKPFERPTTNADRIRGMSDEELAEFIWNRDIQIVERASKAAGFNYHYDEAQCIQNISDWLKAPVEVQDEP